MLSDREYCTHEHEDGRRCQFGPNHRCEHSFKPYRPTEAQVAILEEIDSVSGIRKFACIGTSTVSTLKALSSRGFIGSRYVSSRAWDAWMTPAGKRLLIDMPR